MIIFLTLWKLKRIQNSSLSLPFTFFNFKIFINNNNFPLVPCISIYDEISQKSGSIIICLNKLHNSEEDRNWTFINLKFEFELEREETFTTPGEVLVERKFQIPFFLAHQFVFVSEEKTTPNDDEKRKRKYFLSLDIPAPLLLLLIQPKKYHRMSFFIPISRLEHSKRNESNWKWNGINKYFNRGFEGAGERVEWRGWWSRLVGSFKVSNRLLSTLSLSLSSHLLCTISCWKGFPSPIFSLSPFPLLVARCRILESDLVDFQFRFSAPNKRTLGEALFRFHSRENVNGHRKPTPVSLISDDWIEFFSLEQIEKFFN